MSRELTLDIAASGPATDRPIAIAIVAMGGQGGGVLTNWIVELAESQGWAAQSTSVPGVAQRTGATIYYVETMPMLGGLVPIFSMMPTPGDVDVVIASEYMEAGRSILRGIVTPDRTTLIASDHRAFTVTEKIIPGNGIADADAVLQALRETARHTIVFDMEALAARNGSVISAAMFGALAASDALPFPREAFIDVIRHGGKSADASIRTFTVAFDRAKVGDVAPPVATQPPVMPIRRTVLDQQMAASLPDACHALARAGLGKVVDYQDAAYGREYLDRLADILACDRAHGGAAHDYLLTSTAAKHIANAMTYDDVIRVADLKTRATRRSRVANDLGLRPDQLLQTTEYMHPRAAEVVGLLPAGLGRWTMARPGLMAWLDRRVGKGRRLRTYFLPTFLLLYLVAGLRRVRRKSLRHAVEMVHLDRWLAVALREADWNYRLGVEVLLFRRLIKGYSDTHARGLSKFDLAIGALALVEGRADAADWARRLREAALRDPAGEQLRQLIATMEMTFDVPD